MTKKAPGQGVLAVVGDPVKAGPCCIQKCQQDISSLLPRTLSEMWAAAVLCPRIGAEHARWDPVHSCKNALSSTEPAGISFKSTTYPNLNHHHTQCLLLEITPLRLARHQKRSWLQLLSYLFPSLAHPKLLQPADWQLTWSCNIGSVTHSFHKLEKILTTKTSVELSPPAPEVHQDWSQYGSRVLYQRTGTNAEHTRKASPATRLVM